MISSLTSELGSAMPFVLFALYLIILFSAPASASDGKTSHLPCNTLCRWWLSLPPPLPERTAVADHRPGRVVVSRRWRQTRHVRAAILPRQFAQRAEPVRPVARRPLEAPVLVHPSPPPMPPTRDVAALPADPAPPARAVSDVPSAAAPPSPNPAPPEGLAWERAALRVFDGSSDVPFPKPH